MGDEVRQEPSTNTGGAALLGLAHRAVLLAPTENAFDRLAALLRQAITCMACGAAIDRASSQLAGLGRALVLRHMRCDIDGPQGLDMIPRVLGLAGGRRDAMADGLALGFQHRLGSAAFRPATGRRDHARRRKPAPVLHGDMAHGAEFASRPSALR